MIEYIIQNPHALEVKEKRIPLTYHISLPKDYDKNTIPIIVLHGYGDYSNSEYMTSLHKSMTSKYNVAIITVNYVGTFTKQIFSENKKPYDFIDQSFEINNDEQKINFLSILQSIINKPKETLLFLVENNVIEENNNLLNQLDFIAFLILLIKNKMCNGNYLLAKLNEIGFKQSIVNFSQNTVGDHQDFGLIQAIDILTAVSDLKNRYTNIKWSQLSIVGTSNGGYLASMCDKLAPNTFSKIINNSGWIKAENSQIFSKKNGFHKNLKFLVFNDDYWSEDNQSINFFNIHHKEIRALDNEIHLDEQKIQTLKNTNKKYIFSHTINDNMIRIKDKDDYIRNLKKICFNIDYNRLDCQSKLDGKTFKSLEHGALASLKGLIIDYIINEDNHFIIDKNDFELKSIIKYHCSNGLYNIDFTDQFPKITFKHT